MPLPHTSIFQFYEGNDRSLFTDATGENFNLAPGQLLENDQYMYGEIQTLQSQVSVITPKLYTNWWKYSQVTSLGGITSGSAPALCSVSKTDFVFVNAGTPAGITRYQYNHATPGISAVGLSTSIVGGFSYCGVCSVNTNRIAVVAEGFGLAAYDWDGTQYVQVGNILSIPGMFNPAIAALTTNTVAVWHTISGGTQLKTYQFDGTDWVQVGNTYSLGYSTVYTCIAAMSASTVMINVGSQGRNLQLMTWTSPDWAATGTPGPNTGINSGEADMTALNTTDVLHVDSWNEDLTIYRYTGSGVIKVLTIGSESISSGHVPSMTALIDDLVIYKESHESTLRAWKLEKLNVNQAYRPYTY